jgi:phage terminase large subunit-like protein
MDTDTGAAGSVNQGNRGAAGIGPGGASFDSDAPGAQEKQVRGIDFDSGRAQAVIDFIELLIVPSGVGGGERFRLRAFQKKFIQAIYSPYYRDTHTRVVRRAVLSMARKNGKSALIACLVLAHLIGPEAIQNGEIYSAANDREQAGVIFKLAAQIVRADPELMGLLKIVDSTKTIACYGNGSVYRAISSESGTKHGLNPSVVIYDELAQSRDRVLYDVLDTAMGAREEPLFVTISTQSNDPLHILSQLIDDGLRNTDPTTVTHLYAVPDDFRDLEELRAQASRAKRMPSFESALRNLYLNQRVNSVSPLVPRAEWERCKDKTCALQPKEKIVIALDLSATTDLTALVAVSMGDVDRLKAWFWKPGDLVQEHDTRDRAPYVQWVKDGWIDAPPGKAVDYAYVAKTVAEIISEYEVVGLAYDRWRIKHFIRELDAIGVDSYIEGLDKERHGALKLVPWGQGFRDMAPAIDALEIAILESRLKHDGNPALTFCFNNAFALKDAAGNRKLDKSATRFRIDGAVAATMAIGLKYRDSQQKPPDYKIFFV